MILETPNTTWHSVCIAGVLNITSAMGGTLVGGWVTSRFRLKARQCLKLMVVTSAVSCLLMSIGFFLGCHQPDIRGHPGWVGFQGPAA